MTREFGAYGKIPALGDFLRLNPPSGFVQPWDSWLQTGILQAREALGDSWEAAYMSAPIWRFTLPPDMAGPQAVLGVLMASVDRVGRQFPLTLVCPYEGTDTVLMHFANARLFLHLEHIALTMLEDGVGRETLATGLSHCTAIAATDGPVELPFAGTVAPEALLAAQALSHLRGRAIWSAVGADSNFLFDSKDLPRGRQMCHLFAPEAMPLGTLEDCVDL
ncbi:MAG: type VI secretion system-associated protein TagF [Rhodobacteraceae bacterium]|nr:type VI secretion system-associated protein TagF [Paracoccaceae bacterium]